MAAPDPGFAMMPDAEDAMKGVELPIKADSEGSHEISTSEDQPVAPDQFDPKWETSRYEIWAYYAYYIGKLQLQSHALGRRLSVYRKQRNLLIQFRPNRLSEPSLPGGRGFRSDFVHRSRAHDQQRGSTEQWHQFCYPGGASTFNWGLCR